MVSLKNHFIWTMFMDLKICRIPGSAAEMKKRSITSGDVITQRLILGSNGTDKIVQDRAILEWMVAKDPCKTRQQS